MSYDLYFCTKPDKKVSKGDISEYLTGLPHITEEWIYQNPNTGVYFSFSYSPQSGNEVESVIPSEYNDTNLGFNLNYNRPKFFADEAMPFVEQLCNEFGLLVIDPQGDEIRSHGSPKKASAEHLRESWIQSNKRALSIYQRQGKSPAYIPRGKATDWWKYQFHREKIQASLGDSIFAPGIFLFADSENNEVTTAITWSEAIPFVFPGCDMVIIVRNEQKRFSGRKPQTAIKGWLDANDVRKKLSERIQKVETEIGFLPALLPDKSHEVKSLFLGLETRPISERYIRIAPDSMIDEKIVRS